MPGESSRGALTLGVAMANLVHRSGGRVYIHVSAGRIIDALAAHFSKVYVSGPTVDGPPAAATDLPLQATNIELLPQPAWRTTFSALRHVVALTRAYYRLCRRCDCIFTRGIMPYNFIMATLAAICRRRLSVWVIGNPIALLKTHRRAGLVWDSLSLLYSWQLHALARLGRRLADGAFVCSGQEAGDLFRSPRTWVTATSSLTKDDFLRRADTCTGQSVRILYVGNIRPEKGIEYLLEGLCRLRLSRPWELVLVGPWDGFLAYRRRLDEIIARRGLGARVQWRGYVSYGAPLFAEMRAADLLVLPSLSEGTPHVLLEAQANSLPVVATRVGGIPTVIESGSTGVLISPKDPDALARAIERVVVDDDLRRRLIERAYAFAQRHTVEHFCEVVLESLRR